MAVIDMTSFFIGVGATIPLAIVIANEAFKAGEKRGRKYGIMSVIGSKVESIIKDKIEGKKGVDNAFKMDVNGEEVSVEVHEFGGDDFSKIKDLFDKK